MSSGDTHVEVASFFELEPFHILPNVLYCSTAWSAVQVLGTKTQITLFGVDSDRAARPHLAHQNSIGWEILPQGAKTFL